MESKEGLNLMRIGVVNLNFLNGETILLVKFARELFSNLEDFRRLSSSYGLNLIGRVADPRRNLLELPIFFRFSVFMKWSSRKFGNSF
jgi:hypothetical protein